MFQQKTSYIKKLHLITICFSFVFGLYSIPNTVHAEIPKSCFSPMGQSLIDKGIEWAKAKLISLVANKVVKPFVALITGKVPTFDSSAGDVTADVARVNIQLKTQLEMLNLKQEESRGKEFCLDDLAKQTGEKTRNNIIKKTAQWASEGFSSSETIGGTKPFDGTSFFIESTKYYDTIETVEVYRATDELQEKTITNPDKSPFNKQIAQAIVNERTSTSTTDNFTLDEDIGDNWRDFENDFSVGGWKGWNSLTQNDYNTPTGSYLRTKQELDSRIEKKQLNEERDRTQNFISQKKCDQETQINGNTYCDSYTVTTPGTVIQNQLQDATGSQLRQLEVGDEAGELPSDKKRRELFQSGIDSISQGGVVSLSNNVDRLSSSLYGNTSNVNDAQILYFILQKTGHGSIESLLKTKLNVSDDVLANIRDIHPYLENVFGGLTGVARRLGINIDNL
ncbi:MAG: hypothetical protein ACI9AR_000602 [Flavobacteriaceae bacterium]|jgi:hypothetical protein